MEIKDKPVSMSVREWLIRKLSNTTMISEKIVKQVITHQFDSAHEATKKHKSIEISGFGKFYYHEKKAKEEMEKCVSQLESYNSVLKDDSISQETRHAYEQRVQTVENNMKALLLREEK